MGVVVNPQIVILYDANGVAMAVQDGVAIPASTPAILIAGSDGTNAKYVRTAADGTVRTDPTGTTTQPVSAASLPLPSGAATSANQTTLGNQTTKINDGTNTAAVSAANALKVDGSAVTQPVSAASLPLPTNAATSTKQSDGTQKTQVVDGSGNVQPSLDTVARAGFVKVTDGTNTQPTGDAAARKIFVQPTDGTNLQAMFDVLTRAGFVKLTDGTNNVGVKAASTAAVAADPALVVAISPNNTPVLPNGAATSTKQSDGTQKSQQVDGSGNVAPAGDVAARAGFQKITDGTNTMPTADAVARALFARITDGTNQMPTGDAIARAIYHLITDGTNGPVAVKAASTVPVAADKSLVVVLSPNQQAIPVTATPSGATSGNRSGFVALGGGSSGTFNAIRATTYNEQTSNATRSISSSSASDASAGTGARTVEITYYDSTLAGPFTTTVTLNGTTAVATSASDICFIEKLEVKTVGSNGSNVGTLTLFVNNAGGGGTIGTIAVGTLVTGVGDNRTLWTHHYVATGKTCSVTSYVAGASASTTILIRTKDPTSTTSPEVTTPSGVITVAAEFSRNLGSPAQVPGPARIVAYGIPSTNGVSINAAFDFFES